MNISGSAIFILWQFSTENSSIYYCFLNELSTICPFFVFWAQHIQSLGLSKQILGKNLRIWCQFYLKIGHWHKAGTHQQTHGQTLGHPGGLGQALGQWSRKFCHSFCPLTIGPRPDNWRKCYGLLRAQGAVAEAPHYPDVASLPPLYPQQPIRGQYSCHVISIGQSAGPQHWIE